MTNGDARPAGLPAHSIAHVGYAVTDIRKAIDQWIRTFGAGPFFLLEDIVFDELVQGDQELTFEHSNAFGKWGDIAVEFWQVDKIEPAAAFGPRFAPENGMNHVAYYVDDIPAESDRLEGEGFPLVMKGLVGGMELRVHDAPALGHMIELQNESQPVIDFNRAIADAAKGWDGSDPIRDSRTILKDI
jgi:catechol 2,3-dioxygenase-like lactoylglutathione lyase family enzyme